MTRLPVTGATATAGTMIKIPGNDQGVWVAGNARTNGSFSATVKLHTATATADFSGLCAYAINYPPVAEYTAANTVKITGTPPYYLTYSGGSAATVTAEEAEDAYTLTNTLSSFTDKSGAPGTLSCTPPAAPTGPSANSRCGSGAVTFSASAPDGVTIDWYDAPSSGSIVSGGSGVTSISPSLTQTTTYYAQARNTTTHCVSSSRLSVTGKVSQPGTAGSAPGDCGCKSELAECFGTCLTYVDECTSCAGAGSVTPRSLQPETGLTWDDAVLYCSGLGTGWRLPTVLEAQCACANLSDLNLSVGPGHWWTSQRLPASLPHSRSVDTLSCDALAHGIGAVLAVICVK
jgi:hypothetical protein